MTANRRRKQRVRARAAKTGESYTAALRHLLRTEEMHVPTHQINPAGVTDIGNVRAVNEDYLLAEGHLFAVADGMGGRNRGEVASRIAVQALQEAFSTDPTTTGLIEAVRRANQAVRAQSEADPDLQGMGTTMAAVALVVEGGEDRLVVANVGDSRVYLFRDGQLSRLSSDHSLVADLVRSGQITEDEAHTHPERHILTRALGPEPEVDPHLSHTVPKPGDRILLCSDGLFNELRADEIATILATVSQPDESAEQLVALANEHGGNDNITAIVLDIQRSATEAAARSVPGSRRT